MLVFPVPCSVGMKLVASFEMEIFPLLLVSTCEIDQIHGLQLN